jgi:hypothetical protein
MRGKPVTAVSGNRRDETLRQRGYSDALAHKERQSEEAAYRVGYRGGLKRLEDDAKASD